MSFLPKSHHGSQLWSSRGEFDQQHRWRKFLTKQQNINFVFAPVRESCGEQCGHTEISRKHHRPRVKETSNSIHQKSLEKSARSDVKCVWAVVACDFSFCACLLSTNHQNLCEASTFELLNRVQLLNTVAFRPPIQVCSEDTHNLSSDLSVRRHLREGALPRCDARTSRSEIVRGIGFRAAALVCKDKDK